jgi:hypothetical protein
MHRRLPAEVRDLIREGINLFADEVGVVLTSVDHRLLYQYAVWLYDRGEDDPRS